MLDTLSALELFQGLPRDKLDKIAPHCRTETFQRGTVIFNESDEENDLYVLIKGRASVEMELPSKWLETARLALIEEGAVFGEMSFISGARRSATIRAFDEVRALIIRADRFYEVMEEDSRIGYVVMRHLAECLRRRLDDTNLMWRNACTQHFTDAETVGQLSKDRRSGNDRREKSLCISFPDRRRPEGRRKIADRRCGLGRRQEDIPESK
ncbi:MAG: cyclic nucleotide-binding domain-containing protein [Candidatus Latescibacteria bacterium]|nr:cyclic nucleotide-binding domain-containing protein [Candidatus Latescibacterota bacterium]